MPYCDACGEQVDPHDMVHGFVKLSMRKPGSERRSFRWWHWACWQRSGGGAL